MNDKWALDSNKLLWHMDRVHKHFVRGKRIMPVLLDIGITKACNIRCEFCYGLFQKMTNEMIPSDVLLRLFAEAAKVGIKAIAVIGDGEPTLHPAFVEAIKIGAETGLDLGVATNGVRMPDPMLSEILPRLTWLRFNLSAIEEGYEIVHGRPVWENVKHNILKAVRIVDDSDLGTTVGLQMVLTKNALNYVKREAQFAIDAGVDYFVVKQCSDPKSSAMVVPEPEWFDAPEVRQILTEAEAMSTERTKIIVKFAAIATRNRRPYDHCLDVPLLFQVSGDGKCYPCGYLFGDERYCYGDLKEHTLGEILHSERYWSVIKTMQTTFDVHKDCAGHCRHQSTNKFIHDFVHQPEHINFI